MKIKKDSSDDNIFPIVDAPEELQKVAKKFGILKPMCLSTKKLQRKEKIG